LNGPGGATEVGQAAVIIDVGGKNPLANTSGPC